MGIAGVAFRDLGGSIARLPLALWLALEDVHGKYRRTVLGPLWITLGQAALIGSFAIVFSSLFQMRDFGSYLIYLAAGFPIWALLSQFLIDMPSAFVNAKGMIESYPVPWITHVWRRAAGYLLTFLHHIVILVVVMAVLRVVPTPTTLLVIPGLLIAVIAGSGLGLGLAVVGARYRDLQPAMAMVAGFLMLLTPVIWRPEQLQVNEWIYQYNPLYYYIRIIRDPLLGEATPPEIWIGTSAGAAALFVIGFLLFLGCRRRLYHWL